MPNFLYLHSLGLFLPNHDDEQDTPSSIGTVYEQPNNGERARAQIDGILGFVLYHFWQAVSYSLSLLLLYILCGGLCSRKRRASAVDMKIERIGEANCPCP